MVSEDTFSSVPRLPGWSFLPLICGGVLPPPHSPPLLQSGGAAVSPTDKSRKDSALPPGTYRKGIITLKSHVEWEMFPLVIGCKKYINP